MTPPTDKLEAETRLEIDAKLKAAGWAVQDKKKINLHEKLGVAVREFDTDTGPADGECPVISQDALAKEVGDDDRVDIVLANPPFCKKKLYHCY